MAEVEGAQRGEGGGGETPAPTRVDAGREGGRGRRAQQPPVTKGATSWWCGEGEGERGGEKGRGGGTLVAAAARGSNGGPREQ